MQAAVNKIKNLFSKKKIIAKIVISDQIDYKAAQKLYKAIDKAQKSKGEI